MERKVVIIPCYNEELTIGKVIKEFKEYLPDADIFVYDNLSTDKTKEEALNAGAIVKSCNIPGKGAVLRQAFSEIDADIYIMADGDDTYPPYEINKLIDKLKETGSDLVIGDRIQEYFSVNKDKLHAIGNKIVPWLFYVLYGIEDVDVMSGSRVMSRRFVKGFPAKENGFGIETEMMIYAAKNNFKITSVAVPYRDRPYGSFSKVNALKDGFHIIKLLILGKLKQVCYSERQVRVEGTKISN